MAVDLILTFLAAAMLGGPLVLLRLIDSRPRSQVDAATPRRALHLARGGMGRPVGSEEQGVPAGRTHPGPEVPS